MSALSRARRRAATLVLTALLALASAVALATPANAAVWNCSTGYSSVGAWGWCGSGDVAYFKVNVLCQNRFTLTSRVWSGAPQRVGGQNSSVVTSCDWNEAFYGTPWANSA